MSPLYQQTLLTFEAGVSQGTAANRKRQAELYLRFCVAYDVNYLAPTVIDILMYIQLLKNSFASQISVKNYVSGARTWILHHKGSVLSFEAAEIKQMLAAVDVTSQHVPCPAYPLSPSDVKLVCDNIDSHPTTPLAIKPCILIGYTCFLRSCNLLAPSTQVWKGPHNLLASDIVTNELGLLVFLRSSKTFSVKDSKVLQVYRVNNENYCPVRAWLNYKAYVNPCPIGPAFMVDDYTPLIARNVVDVLNRALRPILPPDAKLTMHSLRRGGTQTAANEGASNEQLMNHGTWKSVKGLKFYLPKKQNQVPNIIASSLA